MMKHIFLCTALLLVISNVSAESWEHLFDNPKYQYVKISPEGKHLAVAMDVNGKRSLAFLNRKTMKYVGGAKLPSSNEVGQFFWANNERLVIKVNKREPWRKEPAYYGELFAVNVDGSGGEMIYGYRSYTGQKATPQSSKFKKKKMIRGWADIVHMLPDDERNILISSTPWDAQGDRRASVFKLDIYNGKINKKRIAGSPISYATFLADSKGELKAVHGIDKHNSTQLFLRKNKQWHKVPPESFGGYFYPIAINEEGTHLFTRDNFKQDRAGLFKFSLEDGSYKNIYTDEKVDVTDVEIAKDGNKIYALRVDDGFPAYLMMNKSLAEAKVFKGLVEAFPQQEVNITSRNEDANLFVVRVSSDIEAGSFYLYDSTSNKLSSLFRYYPKVNPDALAYTDPYSFTASDGTKITGYFTEGKQKTKGEIAPLVVLVHGGPHSRDYWGYSAQTQYLSLHGYSVLQVNFRGSGGFGADFEEAGYLHWGTDIQQDIREAYQWAIDSGKAEAGNSCIMGASFGGYSAITSVEIYPDTYKCAVANAGVYDLELMFEEGDIPKLSYGESYLESTLGTDKKALKAMSPIYHTDKIKVPLFIAHGKEDRRAPFEHAERLKEALDKSNKEYLWYVKANESHGFYDPENQKNYMKQVVGFLDKHL